MKGDQRVKRSLLVLRPNESGEQWRAPQMQRICPNDELHLLLMLEQQSSLRKPSPSALPRRYILLIHTCYMMRDTNALSPENLST